MELILQVDGAFMWVYLYMCGHLCVHMCEHENGGP